MRIDTLFPATPLTGGRAIVRRAAVSVLLLAALLLPADASAQALRLTALEGGPRVEAGAYRLVSSVGGLAASTHSGGLVHLARLQARRLDADAGALALDEALPKEFSLAPNYPNPFNPETTLRFALPEDAEVRLVVFDVLGRAVRVLVSEAMKAGRHEVAFNAASLPSGVYFYRINAGAFTAVRQMTLVK